MDRPLPVAPSVVVTHEGGEWSAWVPGLVGGTGDTRSEALGDLADALVEYAADWRDHLHAAPNHEDSAPLVAWVEGIGQEDLVRALDVAAMDGTEG